MHPTGERLDDDRVVFSSPPGTAAEVAAATLAGPVRDHPPFIDLDEPMFGVVENEPTPPYVLLTGTNMEHRRVEG